MFDALVERFQCPGCMIGSDTKCGSFKVSSSGGNGLECESYVPGTQLLGFGHILLGLPKGFNRTLKYDHKLYGEGQRFVRIYPKEAGVFLGYDHLNVPVWAMEEDGFLFVRCFCPRVSRYYIDIHEGKTIAEICPNAIDVSKFINEID